jgi:hypothetical protein
MENTSKTRVIAAVTMRQMPGTTVAFGFAGVELDIG